MSAFCIRKFGKQKMEVCLLILYCIAAYVLFYLTRKYLETFELNDLDKKAVFITGCDSGFGRELAVECVSKGMPVFAGFYSEKGAASVRAEVRNLRGKLFVVNVDVTNDESVRKAQKYLEEATKEYGGLHAVVNNAGITGSHFFDDFLTLDDYKKTAEVNLWGVIRVTHATKALLKKARGRLVNVTSICARVGIAGVGPYTVSKFGTSGYCEIMRQELRPWGVSVHVLEPGFFKTPLINPDSLEANLKQIWKDSPEHVKIEYGEEFVNQAQETHRIFLDSVSSEHVEWVVEAYLHAITARFPRLRYQIGWDCNLIFVPLSLLPSRLQDVVFWLNDKFVKMPTPAKLKTN